MNFELQNKCHRYEMYSVRNTVCNCVVSLYGDRWQQDLTVIILKCIEMSNHYVV